MYMTQFTVDTKTGKITHFMESTEKLCETEYIPEKPKAQAGITHEMRYTDEKGLHYISLKREFTTEEIMEQLLARVRELENILSLTNPQDELPKNPPKDAENNIPLDVITEIPKESELPDITELDPKEKGPAPEHDSIVPDDFLKDLSNLLDENGNPKQEKDNKKLPPDITKIPEYPDPKKQDPDKIIDIPNESELPDLSGINNEHTDTESDLQS